MSQLLDRLGIFSSIACGVHCMISPLALGYILMSGLPLAIHDHMIDWGFLILTLIFGTLSLSRAKQATIYPLLLFIFGIGALVGGFLLTDHDQIWHTVCMVGGALLVSGAHILNLSQKKLQP
ncbi:MAG: MerC domain-containing protein [Candidatus Caenarcaniphilales bacterium]|nr:MerC domain-containing protein [Candidatus Caenarcaniphilales bacterium]